MMEDQKSLVTSLKRLNMDQMIGSHAPAMHQNASTQPEVWLKAENMYSELELRMQLEFPMP